MSASSQPNIPTEGTCPTSDTGRPRPSASRRRDKPQLSCNHCRRKKLRCDRQHPCHNCTGRGLPCVYVQNPAVPSYSSATGEPIPTMQDRLAHLERLVKSLVPDSFNQPRPALSNPRALEPSGTDDFISTGATGTLGVDTSAEGRSECGSISATATELPYIGDDHWAAILESISDLKHQVDRAEQIRMADNLEHGNESSRHWSPHALLLYGCPRAGSREDILSALPPKAAVDRYVSFYFNHLALAYSVLHAPSFLREYQVFWETPSECPIAWVGLLFSMICLSAIASRDNSEVDEKSEIEQSSLQIDLYREKIVQSLMLAEYTKTGPHILETMIHYAHIEFAVHPDANNDLWYLFGIVANMAMRMGYHRDPSHFSRITPFKAEMQRRIWSSILMGNIVIASQVGMPRMISSRHYDTAEPLNLTDADLDSVKVSEVPELPPSRPETECTPILGVIAMRRVIEALNTISELRAAVIPCTYEEVMAADSALYGASAKVPSIMQMKPMATSVTDSPHVIMWRLFISHLFYKGHIMLHQPYLFTSEGEVVRPYSEKACLDASLKMLEIQGILDEETRPGGQISMMRWRVSSIMNNQFLTATMVLCSMLHLGLALGREEEIRSELRKTRTIWMRGSRRSREAKRAAEAVNLVLSRTDSGSSPPAFDADPSVKDLDSILVDAINHQGAGLDTQILSTDLMGAFDPEATNIDPIFSGPSFTNDIRVDNHISSQNDSMEQDLYFGDAWPSIS